MTVFNVNNRPAVKTWNGLVNDLFADFENNLSKTNTLVRVPVNITESENAYNLELAAPGRSKEFFKLNVEKNTLTVSYDENKDGGEDKGLKSIRKEFSTPSFKRSFTLDEKINAEAIEAKYENGILKVTLPKKEEVKPEVKQINIQ